MLPMILFIKGLYRVVAPTETRHFGYAPYLAEIYRYGPLERKGKIAWSEAHIGTGIPSAEPLRRIWTCRLAAGDAAISNPIAGLDT